MSRVLSAHLLVLALASIAVLATPGCGSSPPNCASGYQPYKSNCLTNSAIQYVRCTEGRGLSTTTEIGGGLGGTFKVVANATLNVAYKKAKQENTPVALQIVKDCLEIAKSSPEHDTATAFQGKVEQYLQQWQRQQVEATPIVTLSSNSAGIGEQVTVTGSRFVPNELVEIIVHATLVAQVQASDAGEFSTSITVPSSVFRDSDVAVTAAGQTSARSGRAPLHIAP